MNTHGNPLGPEHRQPATRGAKMFAMLLMAAVLPFAAATADQPATIATPPPANPVSDWWNGNNATGNWLGLRDDLGAKGIVLSGTYTAQVWGNPTGGMEQSAAYTGLLDFGADVDLQKLLNIPGLTFHTSWLWLSGRNISQDNVGNIFTISSLAGFDTLRCYEMWAEQSLLNGALTIRAGQMGADTEFAISDNGALFLNSTFGWPQFLASNLPNGGPSLPMGAPGVRVQVQPVDWFIFRSAVYQGNVFPQDQNRYGFQYNLNASTGYLWMNEAEFHASPLGLAGKYKAGAWFDTANFSSPDNPSKFYPWNYGIYLIADQKLWNGPTPVATAAPTPADGKTTDAKQTTPTAPAAASTTGLGWFGRISWEPQDRNFLGFYFDTGLVYTGLIPGRDSDQLGFAMAYGQLSSPQADVFLSQGAPGTGYEIALESTYSIAVNKWLSIQPDLQYIIHPGATTTYGNALVLGCEAVVTF